jgi:hypothetical protein
VRIALPITADIADIADSGDTGGIVGPTLAARMRFGGFAAVIGATHTGVEAI